MLEHVDGNWKMQLERRTATLINADHVNRAESTLSLVKNLLSVFSTSTQQSPARRLFSFHLGNVHVKILTE